MWGIKLTYYFDFFVFLDSHVNGYWGILSLAVSFYLVFKSFVNILIHRF